MATMTLYAGGLSPYGRKVRMTAYIKGVMGDIDEKPADTNKGDDALNAHNPLGKIPCLVLADGWYEWQVAPGGKQPWFIRAKGARPLAFAGLWERWKDPADGAMLVSEKSGTLRMVKDGVLVPQPIAGVPAVTAKLYDGLMDIAVHPNFAQNQLIYLTYTKPGPDRTMAITLARGRLMVISSRMEGGANVVGEALAHGVPVGGELTVGAKKILGSAQRRGTRALLQHGSLLLEDDQSLLRSVQLGPVTNTGPAETTLTALLGRPVGFGEAAEAIRWALEAESVSALAAEGPNEVLRRATTHYDTYRSEAMTWER